MELISESKEVLELLKEESLKEYRGYQDLKLSLDMSRGKPCNEQLNLSNGLFDVLNSESDFKLKNGTDARNYGGVDGIPELRELFAELYEVKPTEVIIRDNSSLNVMYDIVQFCLQYGVGGNLPWNKQGKIKFLCPAPGYDRHFGVCAALGIDMITVPMTDKGPDMDIVENMVAADKNIKGIWCVPKYSNPTGVVYSDETVERLAKMPAAAPDFRIFWDNAYFLHKLYDEDVKLKNILHVSAESGNPDRVFMFGSTSKITLAGGGVSMFFSSEKNVEEIKSRLKYQTIGPNKVIQLMHYKFLKDKKTVLELMDKHAEILRPKFSAVLDTLEENFGDNSDIISWTKPKGGYFISVNVLKGCAKRVVQLTAEAGVKLTGAGAAYPYGMDDDDSNIRIAPSYPPIAELQTAIKVFCCAVKLAVTEKILSERN